VPVEREQDQSQGWQKTSSAASQLGEEVSDACVFPEDPKNVGTNQDSAEQQAHYSRETQLARKPWNANYDRQC
jgi:hypothetical protein